MTEPFEVFTVGGLRNRTGDLIRAAGDGKLSIITKDGRPAILAVPFDEFLLSLGVHRALALGLYEARQVTIAQGAKLAALSVAVFIELLGQAGISTADQLSEPKRTLRR